MAFYDSKRQKNFDRFDTLIEPIPLAQLRSSISENPNLHLVVPPVSHLVVKLNLFGDSFPVDAL